MFLKTWSVVFVLRLKFFNSTDINQPPQWGRSEFKKFVVNTFLTTQPVNYKKVFSLNLQKNSTTRTVSCLFLRKANTRGLTKEFWCRSSAISCHIVRQTRSRCGHFWFINWNRVLKSKIKMVTFGDDEQKMHELPFTNWPIRILDLHSS